MSAMPAPPPYVDDDDFDEAQSLALVYAGLLLASGQVSAIFDVCFD